MATINAVSLNQSDVAAAINQAVDGDTVLLPAGTNTWSTGIGYSKGISVIGAGIGLTTLIDNVPKPGLIWGMSCVLGKSYRVSGITFQGLAVDSGFNKGTISLSGGSHSVRFDHIRFNRPSSQCILFSGDFWGVVDHCDFLVDNFKVCVTVYMPNWGNDGGLYGDGSFNDPLHMGTERAVYIEDCTITGCGVPGVGVTDGRDGGRFVIRNNTITDENIGTHGTETSRQRGTRSFEIYNNVMTVLPSHSNPPGVSNSTGIMFTATYLRSGSGVIWGNTWQGSGGGTQTGYRYGVYGQEYRDPGTNQAGPPWGLANGTGPYDGNTDSHGYPAIDQVGRGTCADTFTQAATPINTRTGTAAWPTQASEPVYLWNNTYVPIPNNAGGPLVGASPQIVVGRDAIDLGTGFSGVPPAVTTKYNYTPFVHPHPLVSGAAPPAPGISSALSSSGTVTLAYSYQITATNGPTSFNATSLPSGLSVNTATGLITGVPSAAGIFNITLSATNSGGTGTAVLVLTVQTLVITTFPPVISSPTTASGIQNTSFSYQITATHSPTSYGATSLPAGLAVNSGTGLISGIPTAVAVTNVTISATNADGTGTAVLVITITAAAPTTVGRHPKRWKNTVARRRNIQ